MKNINSQLDRQIGLQFWPQLSHLLHYNQLDYIFWIKLYSQIYLQFDSQLTEQLKII